LLLASAPVAVDAAGAAAKDKRQVKAEQPEDVALRDELNVHRGQRLAAVAQQQQHASQLQVRVWFNCWNHIFSLLHSLLS
jgi:sulfate adenylyltransferase subunit 1 (EFTu-like GTPase family)